MECEMGTACGTYGRQMRYVQAFVREIWGKEPLERPRHRWEDNIKMEEVGWRGMDWIDLAQDWDRWRAFVNAAASLRNAWNSANFLTGWGTSKFSRRIMIYGVSSRSSLIKLSFQSRKFIFFLPNYFLKLYLENAVSLLVCNSARCLMLGS